MLNQFKKYGLLLSLWLLSLPVLADLPQPPQSDIANSSSDWITVGGGLAYRVLSYVAIILGATILFAVASNIVRSYKTAQEKQELGYFFNHLVIGLICAALGAGLVYAGYQIIPSSS